MYNVATGHRLAWIIQVLNTTLQVQKLAGSRQTQSVSSPPPGCVFIEP